MMNSPAKHITQLSGLILLLLFAQVTISFGAAIGTPTTKESTAIVEDVISDTGNSTLKVLRVNPLDPPVQQKSANASDIKESSLYKIKTLLPPNRNYVDIRRMRQGKAHSLGITTDTPIQRGITAEPMASKPLTKKKKQLHFRYKQQDSQGEAVNKRLRVHVAPGAYPIYYGLAKTNGRFGKFPIKGLRNEEEFQKYLAKSKLEPITMEQRYES